MQRTHRASTFRLDATALAQARISPETPLCLARSAWGSMLAAAAGPSETERFATSAEAAVGGEVAIVRISGLLASEADDCYWSWFDGYGGKDGIVARFTEAITDPLVGAVVLYIKSPGGTSAGLEEAIRHMVAARAATGKPVAVYVGEQCSSAAYWIASCLATLGIWGPVASRMGSIGSYIPWQGIAGMLEQVGITYELIADPPGKVAGSPTQPLDELGRARLERDVKGVTARFVAAAAAARGLTPDAVRAINADELPLDLAVSQKLADGRGSFEDVLALAARAAANTARGKGTMNDKKARPGARRHGSVPRAAEGDTTEDAPAYAMGDRVKVLEDGAAGEIAGVGFYEVICDGETEPRYCASDELEMETAAGGAEGDAGEGGQARGPARLPPALARSLVRASGLSANASDAAAAARAAELLGLASSVLELTGAKTAAAALGALEKMKTTAGRVPGLEKDLSKLQGTAAAAAHADAMKVCARAGVPVAKLWDTKEGPLDAQGKPTKVQTATAWAASQTAEQLLQYADGWKLLGGEAAAGTEEREASAVDASDAAITASLSASDRAAIARGRRDPRAFAATKARLFGGKQES